MSAVRQQEKHGMARTPTYASWHQMKQRCRNPRAPNYGLYGERGITVTPRWDDFRAFFADMGVKPAGTSLDRIDNSGNYEPGNCRWATPKQQSRNRRSTKLDDVAVMQIKWLCTDGGYSQKAVAAAFGVTQSTISHTMHWV